MDCHFPGVGTYLALFWAEIATPGKKGRLQDVHHTSYEEGLVFTEQM